jgi:hypothetical protein
MTGGARRPVLGTAKKILLSLLVVGLLSTVTYKRVYATMSAGTTNGASSSASGTVALGNTVYTNVPPLTAGTQCKSWTAATNNNINATCDTLKWDVTTTGLRFPGQVGKAYVAIQNAGSLNAAELQLSMPTCTTSNGMAPLYVFASTGGAGDPCNGGLDMYVQEVTSATFTTNLQCVFPQDVWGTPATDCSPGWIADTVAGLKSIACWDLGPQSANTTRYFVVGIRFDPATATNAMQARNVTMTFRWHLDGGNRTYDLTGNPAGTTCQNPAATPGRGQ